MAKHIREKVYLDGCRVVDGGSGGGSSDGQEELLLLFLADYDYAEEVDLLCNHKRYLYPRLTREPVAYSPVSSSPSPTSQKGGYGEVIMPSSVPLSGDGLPSSHFAVELFVPDKMKRWRLLRAVQRVVLEQLHLSLAVSPTTGTAAAFNASCGGLVVSPTNKATPPLNTYSELNCFSSKMLGESLPSPPHSRQHSGVSVLSDHEVLQLSDVLRAYEEGQRRLVLQAGESELPRETQGEEEEELGSGVLVAEEEGEPAALPSQLDGDGPLRLQRSPLYASCLAGRPENQCCADCRCPFPTWCLLQPFGAWVCIHCIGIHRRLWPNRCREAELDRWPEADLEYMARRGNAMVNDELEYFVAFPPKSVEAMLHGARSVVRPVGPYSTTDVRRSYIQWKYEERLFTREKHPEEAAPLPPVADPFGAAQEAMSTGVDATTMDGRGGLSTTAATAAAPFLITPVSLADDGPPNYAGLLDLVVKELIGAEAMPGAVCVLTNGFQTLQTRGGHQLLHAARATAWDERVQIGIEAGGRKPLYCTIYRGKGELVAAGEIWTPEEALQAGATCMFAVELTWVQLNKKPRQRSPNARWQLTVLTSYQLLA